MDARALVICNWEYTDSTGTLSPLNGPANDLRQIVDAFEDEQFGLFQGQVTTCENLTNEKLRTEVYEFLESAKPNDTLLLYYSGHGERRVDGRLALCGVDTEFPKLNATSFDTNNLREWLEQFNRAPSTMVILDCCYAGQFLKGGVTEEVLASSLGTGTVVIASGGNQPSKDSMSDDACSPFTAALAKILLDPDVPGDVDGFLTADELYSRLMDSAPPLQPMPKRNVQGQGRFAVALRERPAEAKRPDLKGFRTIDVEEIELTFGGDQVSAVLGSGDTDALGLDALDEHRQAAVRRISQLADAVLRVAENDEDEWAQRVVRRAWNCVGTNLFETALPAGVRDRIRSIGDDAADHVLKLRLAFEDGADRLEAFPWEYLYRDQDPGSRPDAGEEPLPLALATGILVERVVRAEGAATPDAPFADEHVLPGIVRQATVGQICSLRGVYGRAAARIADGLIAMPDLNAVFDLRGKEAGWGNFLDVVEQGPDVLVLYVPVSRRPHGAELGFSTDDPADPEWHTVVEFAKRLSSARLAFKAIILMTFASKPGQDSYRATFEAVHILARSGVGPVVFACHAPAYSKYVPESGKDTFPVLLLDALTRGERLDHAVYYAKNRVAWWTSPEARATFGVPGYYISAPTGVTPKSPLPSSTARSLAKRSTLSTEKS